MTAPTLTKMVKIEVVVPGGDASAVRELIQSIGATGYTSVSGVSGLGHHGYRQGRLLFNQQANSAERRAYLERLFQDLRTRG